MGGGLRRTDHEPQLPPHSLVLDELGVLDPQVEVDVDHIHQPHPHELEPVVAHAQQHLVVTQNVGDSRYSPVR